MFFVWAFNIIFLTVAAACIKSSIDISMTHFALAYVSLRWALVIIAFAMIKVWHKTVFLGLNKATPCRADYKRFIFNGAPLALCFGGESFLYFALSIIARNIGGTELAAYQAALHFLSVIYMISIGVGNATAILTAQSFKENKLSVVKLRLFEGLTFGAFLLVPCLLVCIFFSDTVARLYSSDVEIRTLIGENIKIAAPFLLFEFIYVVVRMVLRSLGDSWVPTAVTIFCLNGLGLLTVWLFFEFFQNDIKYLFWSLTICTFVLMVFLVCRMTNAFKIHQNKTLDIKLS
ncbi:hypothetical protein BVY11_17530 [Pseudomonas amygdali pv. morsprunorum]|nr:hypothetical protein BVY11_17530 [Pseudomonas amygdali pv. morsprunorum]